MADKIRIGITGGIGAGKTFVSSKVKELGYPVYDTDTKAKELMLNSERLRNELSAALGRECYKDGKLNREYLASLVFQDKKSLEKINTIVHPAVARDFLQWTREQPSPLVFLESAILFESGFDKYIDFVWNVSAPLETRINRTISRDHTTREAVAARISSQMAQEAKEKLADYVIFNDANHNLQSQIIEAIDKIKGIK